MTLPVALVTGFGPFLDVTDNPSERLARALDGREHAGLRVVGRVLPVSYARAPAALAEALDALRPRCVVAMGAGKDDVDVELVARNRVGSPHPDCDGHGRVGDLLDAAGPDARRPAAAVEARLRAWLSRADDGGPRSARASEDAGGYVCNALYYALLGHGVERAVFVHLPRRPDALAFANAQALILSALGHLAAI